MSHSYDISHSPHATGFPKAVRDLAYGAAMLLTMGALLHLGGGTIWESAGAALMLIMGWALVRDRRRVGGALRWKPFLADSSGSAAVEAALSYPVLLATLMAAFLFGQAFFVYNSLQSSLRSAARYASLAQYDLPNGNEWETQVKNMAVYGDPDPASGATTLAPHLSTANITVSAATVNNEPYRVTVALTNYEVDLYFWKFALSKPEVVFPYIGRAMIP